MCLQGSGHRLRTVGSLVTSSIAGGRCTTARVLETSCHYPTLSGRLSVLAAQHLDIGSPTPIAARLIDDPNTSIDHHGFLTRFPRHCPQWCSSTVYGHEQLHSYATLPPSN